MIELSPQIEKDLVGDINDFDLLVIISNGGTTRYLSTKAQEIYNYINEEDQSSVEFNYYDDLITKVGGIKESIDIKDRKIKLGNTSITINNARTELSNDSKKPLRFTDLFTGSLHGAAVDIYIKTSSCIAITQCMRIASLKITSMKHSSKEVTLSCEDRYIDELHQELPLSKYTLFQDQHTFTSDNERRIPILYGHLKNAPAVV